MRGHFSEKSGDVVSAYGARIRHFSRLRKHPAESTDRRNLTPDHLGGEGGIRTHDTLARIPVFETGTFNRSVTSPVARILPARSTRRFDGLDAPHMRT